MGWYDVSIFAKRLGFVRWKMAPQPAKSNIGQLPSKIEKCKSSNHRHGGVYPEAMACNVGGLCSDFNLAERICR